MNSTFSGANRSMKPQCRFKLARILAWLASAFVPSEGRHFMLTKAIFKWPGFLSAAPAAGWAAGEVCAWTRTAVAKDRIAAAGTMKRLVSLSSEG